MGPIQRLWQVAWCSAPALLLSGTLLLPHLGQPFTIDDTIFLKQAEAALRDPLHPTAFMVSWDHDAPERASASLRSGPVMAYLLLPSVFNGGAEWIAHLIQFFLWSLALMATVSLALRVACSSAEAAVVGLLLAATPAALAMASTCMPDVPAMAFGAVAMDRLIVWHRGETWHAGVAASVCLAIAMLTRSHLVMLVPVGGVLLAHGGVSLNRVGRHPITRFAPLWFALLLWVVVVHVTRDPAQGKTILSATRDAFFSWRHLDRGLVAFGAHWVFALPLAIPWAIVRRHHLSLRAFLLATLLLEALLFSAGQDRWCWVAPIAASGWIVVIDVLRLAWRSGSEIDRILALWILVALPVGTYHHLPAKYLIASAPASALLLMRLFRQLRRPLRAPLAWATISLGVLLGFLILRGSVRLAALEKRAVSELISPAVASGRRVWFDGHWGFQWYAERAGATSLSLEDPPRPGDWVVVDDLADSHTIARFPRRRLVSRLVDAEPGGRVMSRSACAGFFANSWGYLPWAWSRSELDHFEVWEMQ